MRTNSAAPTASQILRGNDPDRSTSAGKPASSRDNWLPGKCCSRVRQGQVFVGSVMGNDPGIHGESTTVPAIGSKVIQLPLRILFQPPGGSRAFAFVPAGAEGIPVIKQDHRSDL